MKKTVKKSVVKAPVKKTVAKKPIMKMGGAKKKMQEGGYPTFQGPITKSATTAINKEYAKSSGPRIYDQDVKDADELKSMRENYDRIPKQKKGGATKSTYKKGGVVKATVKKTMIKSKKK